MLAHEHRPHVLLAQEVHLLVAVSTQEDVHLRVELLRRRDHAAHSGRVGRRYHKDARASDVGLDQDRRHRGVTGDGVLPPLSQRLDDLAVLIDRDNPSPRPTKDSPMRKLSDRQLEVFRLIGQWKGTGEIAKELNLSVKTVDYYREQIKMKLNLRNASELLQCATQLPS